MRKILFVSLVLAVHATCDAAPKICKGRANGFDWTYSLYSDGTIGIGDGEISHFNVSYYNGRIVIPSRIDGYNVVSICANAFNSCTNITEVVIPEGVTSIGDEAFNDCWKLESVQMPDGLKSVGYGAFADCRKLTTVHLPQSLVAVSQNMFIDCEKLREVSFGSSVRSVGERAFRCCESLGKIVVPKGVTSIGSYAFDECTALSDVEIMGNCVYLGSYAFRYAGYYSARGLTVKFWGDYPDIGSGVFNNVKVLNIIRPEGNSTWNRAIANVDSITTWNYADAVAFPSAEILFTDSYTIVPWALDGVDVYYSDDSHANILLKEPLLITDNISASVYGVWNGVKGKVSTTVFRKRLGCPTSPCLKEFSGDVMIFSFDEVASGESIMYTMDGSLPTAINGFVYKDPIELRDSAIIRAVRVKDGEPDSECGEFEIHALTPPSGVNNQVSAVECSQRYPWRDGMDVSCMIIGNSVATSTSLRVSCRVGNAAVSTSEVVDVAAGAKTCHLMLPKNIYKDTQAEITFEVVSKSEPSIVYTSTNVVAKVLAESGAYIINRKTIPIRCDSKWGGDETCCWWVSEDYNTIREGVGSGWYDWTPAYYAIHGGRSSLGIYVSKIKDDRVIYSRYADFWVCEPDGVLTIRNGLGVTIGDGFAMSNDVVRSLTLDYKGPIGQSAFEGCRGLTNLTIGTGVTKIGKYAFCGCLDLKRVVLSPGVECSEAFPKTCRIIPLIRVALTGKSEKCTYDGKPHSFGYAAVADFPSVYDVENGVCFMGTASGVNVGSYELSLTTNMFSNVNEDCIVEFSVAQGEKSTLTILPAEVSQDGNEPWGGAGPRPYVGGEGVHSLYSTESTYDGFGHTIDIETLAGIKLVGGDVPQISYALTSNGVYQTEPIYFTNSCFTSIWYRVESPNHKPYIHEAGISIRPRPVCVVSKSAQKNYDGMPLTANSFSVEGMGFVGDDGVELSYEGAQTWPGSSANDFSYRFKSNTRPENYDVTCESGVLKVGAEGEISIPDGETAIPENAFSGYVGLTQVTIPESVKYVGANAFAGCTSLVGIDFPAGLDVTRAKLNSWGLSDEWISQYCRIDDYLIAGATLIQYVGDASVKKLTVPAGIVRIDKRAFASLGSLEEIEFSGTEKIIGKGAFFQDTKLTKVILHEGIEEIGDEAFFGCTKMANVIIPSSVKSVGAHAFKKCTALTNAQISYGVESIGEECFFSDWRIEQVDIPSTVTNIGAMAFGGDSSIIRAKLRADIRPLSEIFSNYEHIREVDVKICDREVVDGCFRDCKELKDVFWEGDCPRLANDGRELYANTWHGDKNETLTTYVEEESTGWDGIEGSDQLPQAWPLVGSCRCSIAHKDLPTYLCQFDSNGGTLDVQDTYQYSERLVKLPPEPVQSGYKFGGWWTQPIGGLRVTENTIFIEGVYTYLWAHWIKGHTVFLDANGGEVINEYITYVDESVYGVLPSPVRSGYAFDGWLYDGHKIEPDTVMNTKADHTLLAQWRAAQYKVTYHPNGGTGDLVTEDRVYGETEVLRRNAFVRPGYEFLGWSTHKSATSAEYKDAEPVTSLTVVDGEIIELWAVWKESEAVDPTNVELAFGGDADWFKVHQLVEAQTGGQTVCTPCFWQSGKIADNERSDLMTKVFGAGKIGFWWRVDCEKVRTYKWDHLAFFVDNVEIAWTNGVTEWTYLEFAVDGSQEHELIWRYQKDEEGFDGEDCGSVCAVVRTPRLETLEDYAGVTNMILRTGGDAGWFGVKDEVHNQSGSVRSGVITDGQVSSLKSTVDGAGVVRFWWKTDCERVRNYPVDRVLFYVDGVEQAWTNGVSGWVQKHFTITGVGPHDVEWRYVKDEEGSSGRDCAWVSEIEWEPLRVPTVIVVSSEITGGKELVVDEAWPASLDAQFGAGTSAAFVEKFGSDLTAALLKSTGKKSAAGEDMYVWQDYVAGTDPTDPKSQFTATIEMVDGKPVVVWSPKLSEAEAAKRIYTIYGKRTLEGSHGGDSRTIEPWTPVETPAQGGWRFFKVGVEMR